MGKSIFQRLAEYLRDLTAQGEAAPPSAGDPDDKRQPRLIAIEGGKGKGEPDGNEREKPCAVIGIPYSSDAAEETAENEEEDSMKQMKIYMYGVGAAVAAVFALSACGGGGGGTPGATSAPVVSTGTMTKGSVIVNGVRFEDTLADITADDSPKTPAFLQSGMTVKVKGRRNDDGVTGTATDIEVENEVRGTITAKGTDSFTVLGQTVFVDGGTVFDDVANFAALAVGNAVEVHGQRDAAGAIRATRVELLAGPGVVDEVRGVVAGKDASPGPGTFTIGGGTFTFDGGTVIVGGVAFDNGDLVEIHLDAGTNRANRIELEDAEDAAFDPAEGEEFEVEGFVTGLAGDNFFVNGQAVSLQAGTRFEAGLPADLANDVRVEADGHMIGGVLVADKITFKDSVRFEANLEAVSGGPDNNVTVFGRTVFITSRTEQNPRDGSFLVGEGVKIRAFLNLDNTTFTATRIDEESAPVAPDDHAIQGLVISASSPTIVLVKELPDGFTVDTTGLLDVNFKDDNDIPIGRSAFFGALTARQTVVKAKGTWNAGTNTLSAREVEIE
jgi:hypothetical protein